MDNPYYYTNNHTITTIANTSTSLDTATATTITTAPISEADNTEEEEFTSSSLQWDLHDTLSTTTNTTAMSTKDALLHRLHYNERQLRTLAVVLSLTGGLALSFALGVGIMIYWYTRKCKKQHRKSDKKKDIETNSNNSCCDSSNMSHEENPDSQPNNIIANNAEDEEKSCEDFCLSPCHRTITTATTEEGADEGADVNTIEPITTTTIGNNSSTTSDDINVNTTSVVSDSYMNPSYQYLQSQISSAYTSDDIILNNYNNTSSLLSELMLLPPLPASTTSVPLPEPSAPSAKEIINNENSHRRIRDEEVDDAQAQQTSSAQDHHFCQECYMPPPAYTEAAVEAPISSADEEEQPSAHAESS